MGMTIDEAISDLIELKICVVPFTKGTMSGGSYKVITGDCLDVAIDTMRKYQKIEEIMHKVYTSDNGDMCLVQRLVDIREVIEDGNVD